VAFVGDEAGLGEGLREGKNGEEKDQSAFHRWIFEGSYKLRRERFSHF
jgi:hypothetical protein